MHFSLFNGRSFSALPGHRGECGKLSGDSHPKKWAFSMGENRGFAKKESWGWNGVTIF
jgi:hypothetical protein